MLEMESDIINRKENEDNEYFKSTKSTLSSTTCTSTNATVSVPKNFTTYYIDRCF